MENNHVLPVLPVVFVICTAGSMAGEKITKVNEGVNSLLEHMKNKQSRALIQLAVISSGTEPAIICPFCSIQEMGPVYLHAKFLNEMNRALSFALEELRYQLRQYRAYKIKCLRPRIYLITDGMANDPPYGVPDQMKLRIDRHHCEFHPIYIGDYFRDIREYLDIGAVCLQTDISGAEDIFRWLEEDLQNLEYGENGTRNLANCTKYGLSQISPED